MQHARHSKSWVAGRRSLAALLLVIAVSPLPAVELGLEFELGTLGFQHDRAVDDTGIPTDELLFGGTASATVFPTELLAVEVIADRDHVLQNSLTTRLKYRGDRVRFALGPRLGIFNDPDQPAPPALSVKTSVDLLPRLNASVATVRPLQPDVRRDGEYRQRYDRLALSAYGDNLIVTMLFEQSRFREQDDGVERTNRLRRYALQAQAFAKGAPYRILVSSEYHDRTFEFENDANSSTQTYGTLVVATGISYRQTPRVSYKVLLESGLYTFGRDDLLGEFEEETYLFRLRTGVVLSIGR